jgi:hypothetical protein
MFQPSRDEARLFFFETWRKYRSGEPMSALEKTALDVLLLHPEHHGLLDDRDRNLHRDFVPDAGEMNPFLHLSLHLAIEEQLVIDQPPGLRAAYARLAARVGSEHDAKHRVLECLGETMWQAQRAGAPPDGAAYLACVEGRKE